MDIATARNEMVDRQIFGRGICNPKILESMRTVPRESFCLPDYQGLAYADKPLPIGADQTISQPYMVAFMIDALELDGHESVLEIGTGSAYAAAVVSRVAKFVFTIERVESLATQAKETLKTLGYLNVQVRHGDGTVGWKEHAPFDAIIVSAGGPSIPQSLKLQLKVGGTMVIPVGPIDSQQLYRVKRETETRFCSDVIADVSFVRLIGDEGWAADNADA